MYVCSACFGNVAPATFTGNVTDTLCGTDRTHYGPQRNVSSVGSPWYSLAGSLHEVLRHLAGKSEYFVKNSGHFEYTFISLLKNFYSSKYKFCYPHI
jgi:hypothetical protein